MKTLSLRKEVVWRDAPYYVTRKFVKGALGDFYSYDNRGKRTAYRDELDFENAITFLRSIGYSEIKAAPIVRKTKEVTEAPAS